MMQRTNRYRAKPRLMTVAFSLAFISLSGCSNPAGLSSPFASKPALELYAGDPCGTDRADFARSKDFFTDQVVANVGTGILVGGVLGAGAGVVLGVDPGKAALLGAGAGAIVGGTKAYSNIMAEKHRDQAELAKSVNSDLVTEGREMDRTVGTFARLRACRFAQAQAIKVEVRSRRMTRAVALQELATQKARFAEEIALANEYQIAMDKRGEQFKEAADTIKQQEIADATEAQAAKRAAAVAIPDKRAAFARNIKSAEANSEIAFNLDSNRKVVAHTMPEYG